MLNKNHVILDIFYQDFRFPLLLLCEQKDQLASTFDRDKIRISMK